MRIGVDLLSEPPLLAGSGTYARNLFAELVRLSPDDTFVFFLHPRHREAFNYEAENVEYVTVEFAIESPIRRRFVEQLRLPRLGRRAGIDLVHSINNVLPLFSRGPCVVTIHDLLAFVSPDRFKWSKRVFLKAMAPRSARKADRVIAVSENTKQDILKCSGVPPEAVRVIHEAPDPIFVPQRKEQVTEVLRQLGIRRPYMLFLGTLEPGKNVAGLLRAYAALPDDLRDTYRLVIAGQRGWWFESIFSCARELGLREQVQFPGYVPREALPALFSGAELFVYCPFYEGFGLPPLEAMSCGCPVICSGVSSLPEVVGDGACLVDPTDHEALAASVTELLENAEARSELAAKGLQRAAEFSWRRAAEETLALYREILEEIR